MIVIVGGGISGLALAHELAARGAPFLLLEAGGRVGGVMCSGRIDGHLLEWGPQRARLTHDFAALVADLGLHDQLVLAPPRLPLYLYRDGALRRVPFSPSQFVRSSVLSFSGKLRLLLEPFTAAARDDETVAGYFTRKLGREAYEHLVGPLYGGLYASDPQDMLVGLSLRHVLREFGVGRSILLPLLRRGGTIAPPDACSFRDGLATLPAALLQRHRADIRLNTPVHSVRRHEGGFAVRVEGEEIAADDVVITTPAADAARMLRDAAPDAAARVARLNYNPLAVVHLHAETDLHGLGYQVSFAEPLVTRGVTWNDSLFGRAGVYTAYLGGAANGWVAREEDARLAEIAVDEFRQATGFDARVLSVAHERMPAWDRTWAALDGLELPPGIHLHSNWIARPGIPGRLATARRLAARLAGDG